MIKEVILFKNSGHKMNGQIKVGVGSSDISIKLTGQVLDDIENLLVNFLEKNQKEISEDVYNGLSDTVKANDDKNIHSDW